MRQALGALLIALPFLVVAVVCVKLGGWRLLLIAFGGTAAIVLVVNAGFYLLGGNVR